MSTVYVGNPANNPSGITLPDDGDPRDAASVNVPLEGLMDKCVHILDGDATFTNDKLFNCSSVGFTTGVFNLLMPTVNIQPTGWQFNGADPSYTRPVECISIDTASGAVKWPVTPTIGVGETHRFELQGLPNGSVLTSINLRVNPTDDADPTTKISVRLRRTALDGSGTTTVATVQDPASGGSYQAAHLFTATFAHTLDLTTYSYGFEILGEVGGDADPVDMSAPPTVTYSPPGPDWARG